MLNLVLFGPPGAGKGTQSENLINKYNLVHLSTGDILRSEIARGTALGRKAKEIMDRGELVGDDIVIGMIETKIDENPHAKGFIFDGFPRTTTQAVALDDLLQKKGTGITGMLALEVNDEELLKRLLLRGKESGRPDDRDETIIKRRIQEYNNKTLPLKKYYSEQAKFHSINGIGTVDEIFKSLIERITFLKAEMDLTSLETDLEHMDLTIQDFDVADDIAPELLLEIDAIKRAEAEEEEEERELKKSRKKDTLGADLLKVAGKVAGKVIEDKLKVNLKRDLVPAIATSIIKEIDRRSKSNGKTTASSAAKKSKAPAKKAKAAVKKATRKSVPVKKQSSKKAAKKVSAKKAAPSKKSKKTTGRKSTIARKVKAVVKKVSRKLAPKKSKQAGKKRTPLKKR